MRRLVAASVATSDNNCAAEICRWRSTWTSGISTTSSVRSMFVGLSRRSCCANAAGGRAANTIERTVPQKSMDSPCRQSGRREDKLCQSECSAMCEYPLSTPSDIRYRSSWVLNTSQLRNDQKQKQQRNQIRPSRKREQQRVAVGGLKDPSSCD